MLGEANSVGFRWILICLLVMGMLLVTLMALFPLSKPPAPVSPGTAIYIPLVVNPAITAKPISTVFLSTITPASTVAPLRRSVPFFWQANGRWGSKIMGGSCTCKRVSACGCALTSAAMIFKYYGVNTNPGAMNTCMRQKACPFDWTVAPRRCGEGSIFYGGRVKFSWARLEKEVNEHRTPVILAMHKGYSTHFLVVLSGHGNRARNYRIHDPQYGGGANRLLSSRQGWSFDSIIIFRQMTKTDVLAPPLGGWAR